MQSLPIGLSSIVIVNKIKITPSPKQMPQRNNRKILNKLFTPLSTC